MRPQKIYHVLAGIPHARDRLAVNKANNYTHFQNCVTLGVGTVSRHGNITEIFQPRRPSTVQCTTHKADYIPEMLTGQSLPHSEYIHIGSEIHNTPYKEPILLIGEVFQHTSK